MKAEASTLAALAFTVFAIAVICAVTAALANDEMKRDASRLATVTTYSVLIALFLFAFAIGIVSLLLYIEVLQP